MAPSNVENLENQEILSIAANGDISAAINKHGELFTWGSVRNGSMLTADGQIYATNLDEPTLFTTNEHSFSQVALGKDHCAMVTQEGRVMTMGSVDHGKLGHEPAAKVAKPTVAVRKSIARDTNSNAKIGFIFGELSEQQVK